MRCSVSVAVVELAVSYMGQPRLLRTEEPAEPAAAAWTPTPNRIVQVPLGGIPSFRCVNATMHLGIICKFAEGALNPLAYAVNEDIQQHWSQYRPLRVTTCHGHPLGL
ncbi:hypothetical protein WISP_84389 [Willisornis vidua]|uniref:Uncharacterized protein n=1 Tax=Willisornis vidua TaxID=1566151 RepID=A0ABQ9D3L3_9PASS|nr:hypothetical protein WISP_84389 [Willisornis vidua]